MIYFITPTELKQNNVLNANVDEEYIAPALKEAQQIYLKEILGDKLYNAIETNINALTSDYRTLLDEYIKPYLEMAVLASLVVPITMKIRNMGVISQYAPEVNGTQLKDVKYLEEFYRGKAEFYANRLTKYLQQNTDKFPTYAYSEENVTNPTQSQTAGSIYLGGGKRRCMGLKTASGGGSTPTGTVDWMNITNKPQTAPMTLTDENGVTYTINVYHS